MSHDSSESNRDSVFPELGRRSLLQGAAGAAVFSGLSASGAADETVSMVIHAEEIEPDVLPFDADVVEELKATAAESQDPIVDAIEDTDGVEVRNQFWITNALLVEVDTSEFDVEDLATLDGVSWVHENFVYEIPTPADEDGDGEDADTTYGLDQINAPDVWDRFDTQGEGARISVIDTGVDPDHPDLDIDPENFAEFDDDGDEIGDAEPRDSGFHGTHVSGTVVGPEDPVGDPDKPGYGVAPEATLLNALALPGGSGTFAQIAGAMEWSVENDADAMNLSLGALGYFGEMIEPVRNAEAAGTMVVSSSGNDGPGTSSSPGNVFEAVAVGATDEDEEVADFSSGEVIDTDSAWGAAAPDDWPDEYIIPDVSGPGVDVLSAIPDGESVPGTDCGDGDIYCEVSGTSMASPHVAGLVALMDSAAAEDFTIEQRKAAVNTTSRHPDDEDQDTRYGRGIVDALEATGRVAANSGVEGTVLDAEDETPIEGAAVDLDGFPTETDADGEYRLRALEGEYDVSADAFGFASITAEDVAVEQEEFTDLDFELERELAVALVEDQPDVIEAGEEFEVSVQVANLQQLTVDLASTYEGDAWLEVDGEPTEFGEPIEFDELVTGQVTLTVMVGEDGFGDLELEHTFEWVDRDQSIQVTTGPTAVVEEIAPVAVVDVEDGAFGDALVSALDDRMSPRYAPELIAAEDALEAAEDDEYEAFVVQNLGLDLDDPDEDDLEYVRDFVDETASGDTGVLWLDQFGLESAGIPQLAAATDDPGATFEALSEFFFPPADSSVYYHVEEDHPTVEGVADAGEAVPVTTPPLIPVGFVIAGEFHTYFEDYDGRVAGDVISGVDPSSFGFDPEDALAVDEIRSTALASSLGFASLIQRQDFEEAGEDILGSAATFVAQTPPIRDVSLPEDRVDPGDDIEWVFEVDDLVEVEIGLTDTLATDEDEFTLVIDGEEAEFDEPFEFDEPLDDELTITLETTEDTVGRFRLDTRFVTLDRVGQEQTTSVTFRPVSVYDSPLRVPQDIEDPQVAVDFVAPGDEIIVDDGVYEVDEPDRGFQTGLYVGTPEITIRAAEGATPQFIHERDLPAPRIITIDADGVTVDGLHANLVDGEVDEKNSIGSGMIIEEFTSGVTVKNAAAAGTFGIQFEAEISDIHVENVTAIETVIGVGTDSGTFGEVADATITGVTVTDRPDFTFRGGIIVDSGATRVTVTDCEIEIEDGENGIWLEGPFDGGEDSVVANNTIIGDDIDEEPSFGVSGAGIFLDEIETVVEDNEVEDTYFGVRVGDFGFGEESVEIRHNEFHVNGIGMDQPGDFVTFEHNVVEAETGLRLGADAFFGLDADQALAQYNDLAGTDLPFLADADTGFGSPEPAIFDCRQNYLGDREYDETIADPREEVEYEPFLTDPPDEIEFSQPIEIGVDLYLDPDETYGLGVPGPCDLTIWDVLGVEEGGGHNTFSGDVYRWHQPGTGGGGGRGGGRGGGASGTDGEWRRVTGRGRLSDQDSLVGFKVEPDEGVRAVMHFQFDEDAPPGRRDRELGQINVHEGTNIVCAPAYGDESMFDEGTATVESVEPKELKGPGRQMSEWKAEDQPKKPFSAYYVEVSEAGTVECDLDEYDPVKDDLYEAFGLDPVIHEDSGAGAAGTASLDLTVNDVIEASPDDEAAEAAVTRLVGKRMAADIDPDDDADTVVDAIEGTTTTAAEESPSEDEALVEEAIRQAVATTIQSHFQAHSVEDPEAEEDEEAFDTESTEQHASADD